VTDPGSQDTKYETTEISNDPKDYLNGPTGNTVNRTSGGTNRDGNIARVVEQGTGEESTVTGGGEGTATART
jgi:hypothetical protein